MASKEQLRKIAIYCDSYNPDGDDALNISSNVYAENTKAVKTAVILLMKENAI